LSATGEIKARDDGRWALTSQTSQTEMVPAAVPEPVPVPVASVSRWVSTPFGDVLLDSDDRTLAMIPAGSSGGTVLRGGVAVADVRLRDEWTHETRRHVVGLVCAAVPA
jgi:hypothetical protein